MRVYTRRGDDGTTGLLYGGRARKDSAQPVAYGAVDEAQAFLGQARAEVEPGSPLDHVLVALARDLWVLMAELALNQERRDRGRPGQTLVTGDMVLRLERLIDEHTAKFDAPREFVVPGQSRVSAALDVARTVVRRAERDALAAVPDESLVLPYLNRLSDLLWTLARWQESEPLLAKESSNAG